MLLLLASAVRAPAQQILFTPVTREAVEARLRSFPPKDAERQAAIETMFLDAGCAREQVTLQPVPHQKLSNVICVLPGRGEDKIVIGAHFDHIDEGDGIADNWSGASLLPSLFQAISRRPRQHTYVFVAFAAEEQGLFGAEHFAAQMVKAEKPRLKAMINLDTLGLSSTKVWRRQADDKLSAALMRTAAAMKLPLALVDFDKVGSTDSIPFKHRGVPSITLHSVTQENFTVLHSPRDRLKSISLDDYYDTYRLVCGYLAYLDQALAVPKDK